MSNTTRTFSGSDPKATATLLMIGNTMPPARAVLDGVAGAKYQIEKYRNVTQTQGSATNFTNQQIGNTFT